MHLPVLLNEVIRFLDPKPGGFIIDGTVGGGGHAEEILKYLGDNGKLLGIDWDEDVISRSGLKNYGERVMLICGNYADLPEIMKEKNLPQADGLLLDLGFSSEQLKSGKGFSFLADEPLIMTYDLSRKPVREILKEIGESELTEIIRAFSEERFAGRIARAIKERECEKLIMTSGELAGIIRSAVPKNYERGRIDPATRTFQALRIYANDELGNLKKVLESIPKIVKPGGRIAIISFHSLEDRIVKNEFRKMAKEKIISTLTKKPVTATKEEILNNPRSRSAKLRAAQAVS